MSVSVDPQTAQETMHSPNIPGRPPPRPRRKTARLQHVDTLNASPLKSCPALSGALWAPPNVHGRWRGRMQEQATNRRGAS